MAGVQCKFVVYFFKLRLVSWDSDALRKPSHVSYINVGGNALLKIILMKNMLLIILALTIVSCTSDNRAQDNFVNCLSIDERQAYLELVELCDDFIKTNYPNDELNDGYLILLC